MPKTYYQIRFTVIGNKATSTEKHKKKTFASQKTSTNHHHLVCGKKVEWGLGHKKNRVVYMPEYHWVKWFYNRMALISCRIIQLHLEVLFRSGYRRPVSGLNFGDFSNNCLGHPKRKLNFTHCCSGAVSVSEAIICRKKVVSLICLLCATARGLVKCSSLFRFLRYRCIC